MRVYKQKSEKEKKRIIAEVKDLFSKADEYFKKNPELSNKYVKKARRIAMKHKVPLPKELKRKFCHNCHAYLKPGVNLRVRLKNRKVVYFCLECRHFMRIPYYNRK
jgi:ribonuclease P protein subunit RPR2